VALADNVVTSQERADLELVARLLSLSSSDVETALRVASEGTAVEPAATEVFATAGSDIAPGDRVAFTGEMALEHQEWESRAAMHGLQPVNITKATKVLVASDPNSLSGKAAQARSYGIPIITETALERLSEHLVLHA
jgi:DNA polymerase-3 subunit epsilon